MIIVVSNKPSDSNNTISCNHYIDSKRRRYYITKDGDVISLCMKSKRGCILKKRHINSNPTVYINRQEIKISDMLAQCFIIDEGNLRSKILYFKTYFKNGNKNDLFVDNLIVAIKPLGEVQNDW